MTDIIAQIKLIVKKFLESQKLTNLYYGTVISTTPLKVQVDQKLILAAEQLKLTRAVMDHKLEITVDELAEGTLTETFESGNHEYKERKTFFIHNGLVVGDKVTMIRAHGGQQYLIIDKEGV